MGLIELARQIAEIKLPAHMQALPEVHRLLYLVDSYVVLLPIIVKLVQETQKLPELKTKDAQKESLKRIANSMKTAAALLQQIREFMVKYSEQTTVGMS